MRNKRRIIGQRWDAGRVVLVLPEDAALKKFILEEAQHNMRTVPGQIRFLLREVYALRGEQSDGN